MNPSQSFPDGLHRFRWRPQGILVGRELDGTRDGLTRDISLHWGDIGFEIKARHNSAIYISTEDDDDAISYLIGKQKDRTADIKSYKGLRFIFEVKNAALAIQEELVKEPADLVIIDAFSDFLAK